MNDDYSPFPFGFELAPPNLQHRSPSDHLSDGAFYTLPGSIYGGTVTTDPTAREFRGLEFINQFVDIADRDSNPLRNICGSETFRRRDGTNHPDKDGNGAGTSSRVVDYVFETSPSNRVVISDEVTITGSGGSVGNGVSATRGEAWSKDADDDYHLEASSELTSPITLGYLSEKLAEWTGKSRSFRTDTSSSRFALSGAARSESESGTHAIVSGMNISEARNIATFPFTPAYWPLYGYASAFIASLSLIRRKNSPTLNDLEIPVQVSGRDIYRSGTVTNELSEIISTLKWKDAHGIYARANSDSFIDIGMGRGFSELAEILPGDPTVNGDTTARATFISADGRDYRMTVKSGGVIYNLNMAELQVTETRTLLVAHGSPSFLIYDSFSELPVGSFAPAVHITKVEVADSSGGYSEIAIPDAGLDAYGTLVDSIPGQGVNILSVIQSRAGVRWGYRHFGQWIDGDVDAVSYYANHNRVVELLAESATAAAPSPTAADPTPATAPTAPNVSPSRNQEVKPAGGTVSPASAISDQDITPAPTPIKSAVKPLETTAATPAKATPISESKPSGAISKTNDGLRNSGAISKTNDGLRNAGAISKTNDGLRNSGAISKTNDGLRNSGAISKTNDGLRNAGAISKTNDGLRNSGAISKTNDGLRNSGAISKTNDGLRNSGAISKTNDGLRNSGAISKTNDGLRNSGAVSPTNGGLRNAGAVNQRGSGGGLRSGNLKSGGLRGGSIGGAAKKGGGRPSRAKPSTTPVYHKILCGTPVSGSLTLDLSEDFDTETGLQLPDNLKIWKADINGTDWTPEDYRDHGDYIPPGNPSVVSETRSVTTISGEQWSANCIVKFDQPDTGGKILNIDKTTLTVPNTTTTTGSGETAVTTINHGDERAVTNSFPGTTIFAERVIHLP